MNCPACDAALERGQLKLDAKRFGIAFLTLSPKRIHFEVTRDGKDVIEMLKLDGAALRCPSCGMLIIERTEVSGKMIRIR
jgi:hypothetical protein